MPPAPAVFETQIDPLGNEEPDLIPPINGESGLNLKSLELGSMNSGSP